MKVKCNLSAYEDFEMSRKLPDKGDYINRVEIKSSSSDRLYVVAQHKDSKEWKCECPGWTVKKEGKERTCKHLKKMGLDKKNTFLGKYKTAAGPKGTPEDWQRAAADLIKEPEAPTLIGEKVIRKINLEDI